MLAGAGTLFIFSERMFNLYLFNLGLLSTHSFIDYCVSSSAFVFNRKMVKENMKTKDVFNLFSMFGPTSIEWISALRCIFFFSSSKFIDFVGNVVFADQFSCKRALKSLSSKVSSVPPDDCGLNYV